jgi:phosphatidylglycerol:prolipoprotein diacylglycerol transferase
MLYSFAAYLHQIDPYMIKLWESGPIRWYGMAYVVGFLLGYLLTLRVVTVGVSPLKKEQVIDFVVAVALGIVVGGRVGYILFYQQSLLGFIDTPPYWGVIALNHGGMSSHGGILGGIAACLWWSWRNKLPFGHLCDLLAFGFPAGVILGRIANFINGELLGRPCAEDFPLAVKFPHEMIEWNPAALTPEQFQAVKAAISHMPAFDPQAGFASQIIEQVQQNNVQVIQAIEPVLQARHPSQLYAALAEGLAILLVLLYGWRKPQKPFFIAGLCASLYAVARIVVEFFRMPDLHIRNQEFEALGITRGQWLSAILFLLGIAMMTFAARSRGEKLGGWLARPDAAPASGGGIESTTASSGKTPGKTPSKTPSKTPGRTSDNTTDNSA